MRAAALLLTLLSAPVLASGWEPLPTSVGVGVGARWVKAARVSGSGRAYEVSGGGPAGSFVGAFGWRHGALRLGGLGSYELMLTPEWDLDVAAGSPLGGLSRTNLNVKVAHFASLGPFVGAQVSDDTLTLFGDVALLADVMGAELEEAGLRFALHAVPTVRVGGAVDLGGTSIELWLYGSAVVAPRVGLAFALGF